MKWNPHLAFNNRCRKAFEFYEACLGGTIVAMIGYGDTPAKEHMPADTGARIMHARLFLGDQVLTGCEVVIRVETPAEAEQLRGRHRPDADRRDLLVRPLRHDHCPARRPVDDPLRKDAGA